MERSTVHVASDDPTLETLVCIGVRDLEWRDEGVEAWRVTVSIRAMWKVGLESWKWRQRQWRLRATADVEWRMSVNGCGAWRTLHGDGAADGFPTWNVETLMTLEFTWLHKLRPIFILVNVCFRSPAVLPGCVPVALFQFLELKNDPRLHP